MGDAVLGYYAFTWDLVGRDTVGKNCLSGWFNILNYLIRNRYVI